MNALTDADRKAAEDWAESNFVPRLGQTEFHVNRDAFLAGVAHERARAEKLVEAIEAAIPMIRGCSEWTSSKRDHDDPSWCDEKCGDYGKGLRKALKAYREGK